MAILFGIIGLYSNPFLVFIAVFVWFGANQEEMMVRMKYIDDKYRLRQQADTEFVTLSPNDPLAKAVNLTVSGFKQDFPIVERGRIVGVLRYEDLLQTLSKGNINCLVKDIMRTELR